MVQMKWIRFSEKEKQDLVVSWLVISALFVIVFAGVNSLFNPKYIIGSLVLTGIGFLLHELAHKIVAIYYGCFAEYRAHYNMFVLSFIFAFFGFLFAAPGAVMILGNITRREYGHIALA